ncbi:alpha/beta hydrolase [Candidatus Bathyarchaeota archaeon]|nr:alpha/beta hydrolase [Candidatus Bathyarchaeota archaeon]
MGFCKIDGIKIYYEDYGPKDQVPFIFIHGWISSSEFWRNQVKKLKDKRRIIVLDLRGHGRSDKPHEEYSIKKFSEDLNSFMNKQGIVKSILVGHSMGGMITLQFTLDHQEKVEKLILIDTVAKAVFSIRRKMLFIFSQIAFSVAYESFMRYYLTRIYRKNYPKVILEKTLEKVLKNPKYVVKSCYSAVKRFNVSQELANITVPTCIIHGSESFIPLSQAKYLEKKIPNTYLMVIEGAGHATPRETPKKVNEAIEKFIKMEYRS